MAAPTVDIDAILADLGDVPEVTYVAETRVACDGGGGALGHPKTYYTINDEGYARCGYCDRVFIYAPEKASA
jgi:uncharacterized Zn-finger protein